MQGTTVELKSFEILESRINKAVELVKRLRDENADLREQMTALEATASDNAVRTKELDAARMSSQKLERELEALREEKKSVVTRVDAMLKDLDRLSLD